MGLFLFNVKLKIVIFALIKIDFKYLVKIKKKKDYKFLDLLEVHQYSG